MPDGPRKCGIGRRWVTTHHGVAVNDLVVEVRAVPR